MGIVVFRYLKEDRTFLIASYPSPIRLCSAVQIRYLFSVKCCVRHMFAYGATFKRRSRTDSNVSTCAAILTRICSAFDEAMSTGLDSCTSGFAPRRPIKDPLSNREGDLRLTEDGSRILTKGCFFFFFFCTRLTVTCFTYILRLHNIITWRARNPYLFFKPEHNFLISTIRFGTRWHD